MASRRLSYILIDGTFLFSEYYRFPAVLIFPLTTVAGNSYLPGFIAFAQKEYFILCVTF